MPPLASSNLPGRASTPVATPFSMPKSSLSRRLSGIAAQLRARNGPSRRGEPVWRSRAASSLPVPLSPVMRTLTREAAARATSSLARRMAAESPTRSSSTAVVPFSERFSSRRRSRSAASARKRRLPSSAGAASAASEPEEPAVLLVERRRVAAARLALEDDEDAEHAVSGDERHARDAARRAPEPVSPARASGAFARARSRTNGSDATSSGVGRGIQADRGDASGAGGVLEGRREAAPGVEDGHGAREDLLEERPLVGGGRERAAHVVERLEPEDLLLEREGLEVARRGARDAHGVRRRSPRAPRTRSARAAPRRGRERATAAPGRSAGSSRGAARAPARPRPGGRGGRATSRARGARTCCSGSSPKPAKPFSCLLSTALVRSATASASRPAPIAMTPRTRLDLPGDHLLRFRLLRVREHRRNRRPRGPLPPRPLRPIRPRRRRPAESRHRLQLLGFRAGRHRGDLGRGRRPNSFTASSGRPASTRHIAARKRKSYRA